MGITYSKSLFNTPILPIPFIVSIQSNIRFGLILSSMYLPLVSQSYTIDTPDDIMSFMRRQNFNEPDLQMNTATISLQFVLSPS